MKNICFIIGSLNNSGGTERVTSSLANELCNNTNHNIKILSLSGDDPFFSLNPKISIHKIYSKTPSFKKKFIETIFKIRKYVISNNIDTLVVVDSILTIFTVPALFNLDINHICWEHFNYKNDLGIKYLRRTSRKLAARYCDYIVTLTNKDKSFWLEGLRNITAKIVPIPNPCPEIQITQLPQLENKVVLSIGRLDKIKGFDLLLEAWSKVTLQKKDWSLYIVGSGEEESNLKKLACDLGVSPHVKFFEATKDINFFYKSASIYCLSSRAEGLPMVMLEAQSYGIPIVSFDCDTGPSEIIQNGYNGYLCDPNSVDMLAEQLLYVINLPSETYRILTLNARENSINFNLDKFVKRWENIL